MSKYKHENVDGYDLYTPQHDTRYDTLCVFMAILIALVVAAIIIEQSGLATAFTNIFA